MFGPIFLMQQKKTTGRKVCTTSDTTAATTPNSKMSTVTVTAAAVAVAVAGGSVVSRVEFEALGTEELIKYLATQRVVLDSGEQAIFKMQKIDGEGLIELTIVDLERYGIAGGVASKIIRKILQ